MKIRYLILSACFILLSLLPLNKCFSKYGDPGIPDTIRFGEPIINLTGPPYQGTVIVPIIVFNDEPVGKVDMPFLWTGPLWGDSGRFVDERGQNALNTVIAFDNVWNQLYVGAVYGDPRTPPYMVPGSGEYVYLYFSILDTGFVFIDSSFLPWQDFGFLDSIGFQFIPIFWEDEFYIRPTLPGDVNHDGQVDVGDVVFLINYLFRNSIAPEPIESGDVNGDCLVDVGDVVYLINYLFKNGPEPHEGC
jgi:hypothetical protein